MPPIPMGSSAVSFQVDVLPLFREGDRNEMLPVFDLWSYDDVSANADRILERLEAGDMPCDGRWPPEQLTTFSSWIEGGLRP
jgi:hypothetical protein